MALHRAGLRGMRPASRVLGQYARERRNLDSRSLASALRHCGEPRLQLHSIQAWIRDPDRQRVRRQLCDRLDLRTAPGPGQVGGGGRMELDQYRIAPRCGFTSTVCLPPSTRTTRMQYLTLRTPRTMIAPLMHRIRAECSRGFESACRYVYYRDSPVPEVSVIRIESRRGLSKQCSGHPRAHEILEYATRIIRDEGMCSGCVLIESVVSGRPTVGTAWSAVNPTAKSIASRQGKAGWLRTLGSGSAAENLWRSVTCSVIG